MVVRKKQLDALTAKRIDNEIVGMRAAASIVEKRFSPVYKKPVTVDTPHGKGFLVTISSDRVDRMGDIVEQDWANLKQINEVGLIACFAHDTTRPIGRFFSLDVREEGGNRYTDAVLVPLPKGTSADVDLVIALLENGWIDFSIGAIPGDINPIKQTGGLRLGSCMLIEVSAVAVPANGDAQPKRKDLYEKLIKVCDPTTGRCHLSAKQQLEEEDVEPDVPQKPLSVSTQPAARDSAISGHRKHPVHRNIPMNTSLSDRINAAEETLVAKRDALTAIIETEVDESGELTEEASTKASELASQIEKAEVDIANLKKYENALRAQVKSAVNGKADRNPYVSMQKQRPKGYNFFGAVASHVKAHADRTNPFVAAESYFKDDPEIGIIVKADVSPATMTDANWASKLVQESVTEFFDLLRDQSIYQQIPGLRLQFGPYGSLVVPYNSSARGAMSGGFVGEGSAIPVKSGSYGEKSLKPSKFGVIIPYSKEIEMHSMPSITALIQNQMLADTAEALDTAFFDTAARSATRPAGMQHGTDGAGTANINASAGSTVANITTDLKGVLGRALAARVGSSGVWVMNPLRRLGLMTVQDAASGEYPFRDELNRGTLYGYPVVTSQNMAADLVAFIPSDTLVFANDYSPRISVSDTATLHMNDTALPIHDGTTAADPVRSLYQTDSVAVRMTMGLDWQIIRANGVQLLTSVGW